MDDIWKQIFKQSVRNTIGLRNFKSIIRRIFHFIFFTGIALFFIWVWGSKVQFIEEFNWIIATILAIISGILLMFIWQFLHGTPVLMLKASSREVSKLNKQKTGLLMFIRKMESYGSGIYLASDSEFQVCKTFDKELKEYYCNIGLLNFGEQTLYDVEIVFTGKVDVFNDDNEIQMSQSKLKDNIILKQVTSIPLEFVDFIRYRPENNELFIQNQSTIVDTNNTYALNLLTVGKDINETKWVATVSFNNNEPTVSIKLVEKIML